jgi:hypothetical protein
MILRSTAAVLAVLVALAGLARIAEAEIVGHSETRASDALPLYLSGGAVAAGLDPTREASLAKVYDARALSVGAATFSTLYPATAGVLMRAPASLAWADFTTLWRWILLGAVATFGLAAGAFVGGDRGRRALGGGGVTAVLAWHPVTAECVRLGQVNLVLGALCAVAMAGVAVNGRADAGGRRPLMVDLVVGAALGLGGALKLVPAALLLPIVATRRWRPIVGAAVIGLGALLLVLPVTPLPRVIEAIRETLRFQATIDPDWLVGRDPAPDWMRLLGFVRHTPLQWITLAAVAIVPAARPSPRTALAGMALLCAWLGADAAGFHVLYAPLAYPVFLLLLGRPVAFVALAAAFYALSVTPAALGPEPRMVLFGLVAWAAAAATLLRDATAVPAGTVEADGEARQAGLALAGVATGILLVGAVPGDGPVAAPLPEGQTTPDGAGFIRPSDRVPGAVRALGAGMDRPASTLARPGTIRALQLYLRGAPVAWGRLAERYPARADLCAARAAAAPGGDLRDHSGRAIAAWLSDEQATVTRLQAEGLDLGDIPTRLAAALASGLADPSLGERIPHAE